MHNYLISILSTLRLVSEQEHFLQQQIIKNEYTQVHKFVFFIDVNPVLISGFFASRSLNK